MIKKILGLVLLFLGITIILYGLYASFNIFTAKAVAPEIFSSSAESYGGSTEAFGEGGKMEEMISDQLKGLIPTGSISHLLNLIAWSIFASILIFGGSQVASLGIKLLK